MTATYQPNRKTRKAVRYFIQRTAPRFTTRKDMRRCFAAALNRLNRGLPYTKESDMTDAEIIKAKLDELGLYGKADLPVFVETHF